MVLLTRREHSRKELLAKLTARGVEDKQALAAVDALALEGWQDDVRFAEFLIRSRASCGYGPFRIRTELESHGLDREEVAAALDAFDGDWSMNAHDLVWRRFGPGLESDRTLQRKAADFLFRRGFGTEHVLTAFQLDEAGEA
jgi:regulatory protein